MEARTGTEAEKADTLVWKELKRLKKEIEEAFKDLSTTCVDIEKATKDISDSLEKASRAKKAQKRLSKRIYGERATPSPPYRKYGKEITTIIETFPKPKG
ncbi:hypothetical protein RBB50_010741 [Rhinocladiella similis]